MKRKLLLLLIIMLSLGYVGWGQKTWTGLASDGLWASANNWSGGTVPISTDNVVLDNSNASGSYTITINNELAQTIHSLQIGYSGNVNTITLIVSGSTPNVLTINGGGATALHIMDGGVLSNQSTNGTRGIKLGSSSDVFKMSGTGGYVHVTTTTGSAIPQPTSTTSANYDFAVTSVFENQSGSAASFDANPVYGDYIYNNSSGNSAAKNLTINGNLSVLQGTLGVCASTTNTFTIAGNILIFAGATFRGSSGTGTATINVAGNIGGAGILGGTGSSSTTIMNVGGDITSQVSLNTGINTLTFTGGSSSVNFSPANSNPSVRGFTIASGKTVTLTNIITIPSLYIVTINNGGTFVTGTGYKNSGTLIVNGILDCGTNAISGSGAFTLSSGATLKTANISGVNGSIAVTGTKTFDNAANYEFNGASAQVTGVLLPATVNNFTIDNAAGVKLSNSALTVSGNLTINDGKLFTIDAGKSLTVSGALANNASNAGLVIEDGGSLITNGTVSGGATVKRTFTGPAWHLMSAPVENQAIFTPYTDMYYWDEATYTWLNHNGGTFSDTYYKVGKGYLVSWAAGASQEFAGNLNTGDKATGTGTGVSAIPAITYTSGQGNGYNLIGNPYPSALNGSIDTWTKTNMDNSIWVYDNGNYLTWNGSLGTLTGGIIPAMQGFWVKANSSSPSLTIPNSARTTSAQAYYKESAQDILHLQVDGNGYRDGIVVNMNDEATNGYDHAFDVFKMYGDQNAPQMYSLASDNELSINVLPHSAQEIIVPVALKVGQNNSYTISVKENTFNSAVGILLEDTKDNNTVNLCQIPSYTFTANTDDNLQRFKLHFNGATGINEPSASQFSIYAGNGIVYVNNSENQTLKGTVTVYSITGQAITTRSLTGDRLQKLSFNNKPGCYIVRVTTDKGVYSQKIIL